MERNDTPITTELVRLPDGTFAIVARAIFVVPEGAGMREAERDVLREGIRAAHRAADVLVREHLVAA